VSRYEILQTELGRLRIRQAVALIFPTGLAAVITHQLVGPVGIRILATLAVLVVIPILSHHIWKVAFPAYRTWSDRINQITDEINHLRRKIAEVFNKYRERRKGEHFKKAYNLSGRPISELEEALSVGMYRERREVFVTAFVRAGVAVRVTASIGSPFRCSASDNPARWQQHAERLSCDEIRQYHNHPVHNGTTSPSSIDIKTSATLKSVLNSYGSRLRSLVICWNGLREWKIFEYDEKGRHWLHFEFDAAG
jgi:hypothetical protein